MSYNGSGTYSAPASTWNPAVSLTTISSTDWAALLADITTALSTCLLKDGQQTPTANIPMGGFKLTGLAAGTGTGNSLRYEQLYNASGITLIGNIAMGGFKLTGLSAGSASGESLRYEQVNGVVTTAGDTVYATGAGALSRLAIGTAGVPLVVNSGATAPQWGFANQSANVVYAGPSSGSAAAPSFRALTAADGAGLVYLGTKSFSAAASVTFGTVAGATADVQFDWTAYHEYIIDLVSMVFSNNATLTALISLDGGVNYRNTAADYTYASAGIDAASSASSPCSTSASSILMTSTCAGASSNPFQATIRVLDPNKTGVLHVLKYDVSYETTTPQLAYGSGVAMFQATTGVLSGLKVFPSSNTFTGTAYVYGKRNA